MGFYTKLFLAILAIFIIYSIIVFIYVSKQVKDKTKKESYRNLSYSRF